MRGTLTRPGWWRAAVLAAAVMAAWATWLAFAPLPQGSRELVYVIPMGTAEHQASGHSAAIFPSRVRLTLGVRDVLVLRNEDVAPQAFGPVLLQPGQSYRVPFQEPATFDFACSVHPDGQVSIVVRRAPDSGWDRLRWRIVEAFAR